MAQKVEGHVMPTRVSPIPYDVRWMLTSRTKELYIGISP